MGLAYIPYIYMIIHMHSSGISGNFPVIILVAMGWPTSVCADVWEILVVGASLSEPHIDETNARNPYIMFIIYVWYVRHARTAIDIV